MTTLTGSTILPEHMSEETCDEATGLPLLPDGEADRLVKHYACSACWSHLVKFSVRGTRLWAVKCIVCGNDTRGYVSQKWVERRLSESHAELQEAKIALHDVIPLQKHSESEILGKLGF